MREPGEEARCEHRLEGRKQRRRDRRHGERGGEAQQQGPPREARGECGDRRGSHHDAERVGADRVSGLRCRDVEFLGDVRQQAHDGKLAGADTEAADRERQFDQRDGKAGARNGGSRVLCSKTGFLGNGHVGHEASRFSAMR